MIPNPDRLATTITSCTLACTTQNSYVRATTTRTANRSDPTIALCDPFSSQQQLTKYEHPKPRGTRSCLPIIPGQSAIAAFAHLVARYPVFRTNVHDSYRARIWSLPSGQVRAAPNIQATPQGTSLSTRSRASSATRSFLPIPLHVRSHSHRENLCDHVKNSIETASFTLAHQGK